MAQMQNMIDFPPAPKLDAFGKLDRAKASKLELMGEKVFYGKGRCAECHNGAGLLDQQMHDLHLEQFYVAEVINGQTNEAEGPIKTFTLRGIKDSPPYLHDGRLLTLADTVAFFNFGPAINPRRRGDAGVGGIPVGFVEQIACRH